MAWRQFKKKHLFIVLFLGISFLCVNTLTHSEEPFSLPSDIYEQLKAQIKKELRGEIKDELYAELSGNMEKLVRQEVQRQWESYLAEHSQQLWEQHAQATQYFNYADEMKIYAGESLDDAVGRIVREIFASGEFRRYITNHDLDQIVAGRGIPHPVPIASGFRKHPTRESFELAKAEGAQDRIKDDDKDLTVTAGQEEQPVSIERTLQQKGSILLHKGQLQFEPSTAWAHFSSNNINIQGFLIADILAIGNFATEEINRDILIQTFAFKYGLMDNLQGELKVPFRGQYNRNTVSQTNETASSRVGVGDVELALSRQIGWEGGWMPDLIAAVNLKTRTGQSPYNRTIGLGTGHYALRTSLIAAKSSDPAVVFGSLSYTHNFKRDISGIGEVNPGDSIGYSIGMAIALSYQTAINFSFEHSLTDKLRIDGSMVNGSLVNAASVKIGANWAFNEKASMDFGVSFGVTDDAPDVTAEVRFPILF